MREGREFFDTRLKSVEKKEKKRLSKRERRGNKKKLKNFKRKE